jgi:hypothetical protein
MPGIYPASADIFFEQAAENKIEAFSLQEQAVNVTLTS